MDIKPPKKHNIYNVLKKPDIQPLYSSTKKTYENLKQQKSKLYSKIPAKEPNEIKRIIETSKKNLNKILLKNFLKIFLITSILALSLLLYVFKIFTFPKTTLLDSAEYLGVQSFTNISSNIVFAPQKFLDYIFFKLHLGTAGNFRLSSIIFTLLAVVIFYFLIKSWLNVMIASIVTLLFASSSWVLAEARSSDFSNGLLMIIPLFLFLILNLRNRPNFKLQYLLFFLLALAAYSPGYVWILLVIAIACYRQLFIFFKDNSVKQKTLLGLLFFLPLLPLIVFLAMNTSVIKLWLGFSSFSRLSFSNVFDLPKQLFFSGIDNNLFWLNGTPIIDAATCVLTVAGIIYIYNKSKHHFRKLLISLLLLISLIFIGLSGYVFISLLLPLIYIFVAFGIAYLLKQWFAIFPRNPFARSVGYILMCLLAFFISFYHISRYYVIWPKNENVIRSFDSATSDTINSSTNNKFYLNKGE